MALEKDTPSPAAEIVNAVKLVGDVTVIPGISLLMRGSVLPGGAHAILGFLAWRFLGTVAGPISWILLAANAYAKSSSGSYLHDHIIDHLFSQPSEPEGTLGRTPSAIPEK
jgi:hypothetical protein